jgi:ADP-L-glycero-D-manno-heptose 6-epimerase
MIIVTGGAGFIGSNLVAALHEKGLHHIVVADRLGSDERWHNLRNYEVAEIIAPERLIEWMDAYLGTGQKIEAVFHMGGIASTTEADVNLIVENNLTYGLKLWRWCSKNQVRFIYASSVATYGGGDQGFKDDQSIDYLRTLKPLNPYGWSKNLFDLQVMRLVEQGIMPPQWVALKLFHVYGPNEYHKGSQKSVLCQMHPVASRGLAVKLFKSDNPKYKDGEQVRDFVYIKDCCDVMLWFYDNPTATGIFNVGTGKARTFKDLALNLFKHVGHAPKIDYNDMPLTIRDKYQYFTEASLEKLQKVGYNKQFTSLEDGVADYVKYLNAKDPYR